MLLKQTWTLKPALMGLFSETNDKFVLLADDRLDITDQAASKPVVSERAMRKFEKFNFKPAKEDVRVFRVPEGPWNYMGRLKAIVYVSDKAGTSSTQEWVHQTKPPHPHVWKTASGDSCWIIHGGRMHVGGEWLEG